MLSLSFRQSSVTKIEQKIKPFLSQIFEESDGRFVLEEVLVFTTTSFDFFISRFDKTCSCRLKSTVVLSSNLEKYFTWSFFKKLWGFEHGQFGTINERYFLIL